MIQYRLTGEWAEVRNESFDKVGVTLLVALFVGRVPLTSADPVSYLLSMRVAFIVFYTALFTGNNGFTGPGKCP